MAQLIAGLSFMSVELGSAHYGWLSKEVSLGDAVILLATFLVLTSGTWSPLVFKPTSIPNSFWYEVPQATDSQASSRQETAEARNIARVFEQKELDIIVFWGSQSGRGELLARQFTRDLQDRYGLRALAADSDDFDFEHLAQLKRPQLCSFVLSTYGDGDPPDNASGLWNFLHAADKHGVTLGSLRYLLFGLGNSNYRQYNQVAETVDALLCNLGGERLGRLGAGDDAHGETESHFLTWKQEIYPELESKLGLKEQKHSYQPAFDIQHDNSIAVDKLCLGEPYSSSPNFRTTSLRTAESKQPTPIKILQARKLWETDQRLCIHMELDLGEGRRLKYKTGDHLAVWACNPDHEVRRLLALTGHDSKGNAPIRVAPINNSGQGKMPVPSLTTPDALFRHYLEISGQLSLETVAALAEFAPSEDASSKLLAMGQNMHAFRSEVLARHLTLAGLLEEVGEKSQWEIPLSFLLERLKPMQPRYYSISSSASVQPRVISITVVVDKPPNAQVLAPWQGCYGLATSYLFALEKSLNHVATAPSDAFLPTHDLKGPRALLEGGGIFASIRQSSFKLPTRSSSPIIVVGAGTGVAPFRAFVQERAHRKQIGEEVGATLLFMGFRNSGTDFIYEQEWRNWEKILGPKALQYWTAFSRDDSDNKSYVHDLIKGKAAEVLELLEKPDCRFYICGSASMARDVVAVLAGLRATATGESEDVAMGWIRRLRQFGTLLEDVWG
ncbi:hypothetical protein ACJ41O_012032 [Fusarium nematophilum]